MFGFGNKKLDDSTGIEISNEREGLHLERKYHKRLTSTVTATITVSQWLGLLYRGELTQTFGKWVLYDPQNPADKIIDRDLLPLVEEFSKQAIALDREWRKSVTEFTDSQGNVWRKV